MNKWNDLSLLDENNKDIVKKYFPNCNGKFLIENEIMKINIDNWGIEKLFMNENFSKKYEIIFDDIGKIYSIGLLIQIGNWKTFKKMINYLDNFSKININIYFVIIDDLICDDNIALILKKFKNCVILSAENKGMDIGLFLINLFYLRYKNINHSYLIKIHTKTNDEFRNNTLTNLIGSYDTIINNIKKLNKNNIGMISGNTIFRYNIHKEVFKSNLYHLTNLANYFFNENIDTDKLEFSAGTMFIVKSEAFVLLDIEKIDFLYNSLNNIDSLDYYWYSTYYKININNKKLIEEDYLKNKNKKYPNNINFQLKTGKPGLRDCMIEHGVERLFGYICRKMDFLII